MSRNRETMSDSSEEDNEVASDEESDSGLQLQQTQSAMARPLLPPPSSSPSEESETELNSDSVMMQTQDINELHSFIDRRKLLDKIRRMWKKFEKKIKDGKEVTFSKPHEESVHELSKIIWGNEEKAVVVRGSSEEVVEKKRRRVEMLMDGGGLFGSGEGVKGEKEWEKLRVEELQNYLKHLEVRVAQTKLVLGAMMKHS
ncbi:hypothetical protein SASPL_129680 [Salvia splendens]|uniref:Glabrous enhancer-binding protein-like DBD domain-containing protein n=1 Tax=Salvia splendens TaxID=180675 RepID=A0A8X8ZNP6_SALSN|nr:hypothetical protein SASPL_129680 [Salvia splendens]